MSSKNKVIYLENTHKRKIKGLYYGAKEVKFKTKPETGWQYRISIQEKDIPFAISKNTLIVSKLTNIEAIASNPYLVKIPKEENVKLPKKAKLEDLELSQYLKKRSKYHNSTTFYEDEEFQLKERLKSSSVSKLTPLLKSGKIHEDFKVMIRKAIEWMETI